MQKGFATILIILGLVIFGGAVGGAYFLGTKRPTNPLPSPVAITTVTPVPTVANSAPVQIPSSSQTLANIPNPTIAATPLATVKPSPLKNIPLMSTNGWQTVTYKGVSFKISPNHYSQESTRDSEDVIYIWLADSPYSSPLRIVVTNYYGGSRRDQFYKMYPYAKQDCGQIYEEASYGGVKGLQIAQDGGLCQGGGGATIVVVGSKLVILHNLNYAPETKEIYRWQFADTLISTLKSAE